MNFCQASLVLLNRVENDKSSNIIDITKRYT